LRNDRLRWSFFKWRIDVEDDVASFWKTNNSNSSSQIDFVNCLFSFTQKRNARRVCMCVCVVLEKNANKKRRLRKRFFFCRVYRFLSFEIDSWINRSLAREHKKKKKKFTSLTRFRYLLFYFISQTSFYSILF
jgi:hypothetical protein